jgi:hypothetical protein
MDALEDHFCQFMSEALEYTGDENHTISETWLYVCYLDWFKMVRPRQFNRHTLSDMMSVYSGPAEPVTVIDWLRTTADTKVYRTRLGWKGWKDRD